MKSLAALLLFLIATAPVAADDALVAYVGGTIHPVSSPPVSDGVMVTRGSRIEAVGPKGSVPAGARVVDISGKHLYPGFVHPLSQLGLIEIGSVTGTNDTRDIGDYNPHHRAEVAVNAESRLFPVASSGGVLTAHVVPGGGVLSGTSAVLRTAGWNWEQMTLAAPIGQHLDFPAPPAASASATSTPKPENDKALQSLDRYLEDARAYGRARTAVGEGKAREIDLDPRLEALQPLLAGEQILFVHAHSKAQIEGALDWVSAQGFKRVVLVTGADASYLADRIAKVEIPVIFEAVLAEPERDFEPYDFVYAAPSKLHAAGIKVAIAGDGAHNARNQPFEAAMAAAFGLPKDEALASVTLRPAEILGLADRLGSLEAGKLATFFLSDGDPLEIRTPTSSARGSREKSLT